MTSAPNAPAPVTAPQVVEDDDHLVLCFDDAQVQSRVSRSDPDHLVLAYTRVMMGFLLFVPRPERIAMIGLGGGALARCCRRVVPDADFTAVEIAPEVVALREVFGVPPDGPRFRIVLGDGAAYVDTPAEPLDVLLVDGFDRGGQPAALCSAIFYERCRARLREGGVLVVNLTADATGYGSYVRRVRDAFGGDLVVVETDDQANKLVFAGTGGGFPPAPEVLLARARALETAGIGLVETADKVLRARRRKRT